MRVTILQKHWFITGQHAFTFQLDLSQSGHVINDYIKWVDESR